jgi:hypothetical protein
VGAGQDRARVERGSTSTTFDVTAGAEERVVHRLGRTPTGWRVVAQSAPGSVYASTTGRAHDRKYLYLKSSTAGLTVQLEVF